MKISFNTLNKQYSFEIKFTGDLYGFTKLRDNSEDLVYCIHFLGLFFWIQKRNWVKFDFADSLFIVKYYPYTIKYSQGDKKHNFFFDNVYGFATIGDDDFADSLDNFQLNFNKHTFYGFVKEKATKLHNLIFVCKSFKITF